MYYKYLPDSRATLVTKVLGIVGQHPGVPSGVTPGRDPNPNLSTPNLRSSTYHMEREGCGEDKWAALGVHDSITVYFPRAYIEFGVGPT